MKKLALLLFLFLAACGATSFESPATIYERPQPSVTVMPTATATLEPTPTPTVGYQATAIAAQQTADAAQRLMVEATSEYERREYELIAFTAEAESRQMWIYGETATAAMSAIPATQTQAAMMAVAIATQQSIMITSQVMTQNAPTMIVALANAQSQAQYATIETLVRIFALFGLGCFLLGIGLWLLISPPAAADKRIEAESPPEIEQEPPIIIPTDWGTLITIKQENTGGYTSAYRSRIPCTPTQLTELAEGLISGQKTLAINQWEGKNSKAFTRELFLEVRSFLQINRLAQSAGSGKLILTSDGEAFLNGWLGKMTIPPSYEFGPKELAIRSETAHEYENHGHDHAVGELRAPDFGTAA